MMEVIARNWGWVASRGVVALLFGIVTIVNPAITLVTLLLVYGAFAFADGVFAVIAVIANRGRQPHWAPMLFGGIAGIGAGIITWVSPGVTATILVLLIATWLIVTGLLEFSAAVRMRREIAGEWWLMLVGGLSVVFGLMLLAQRGSGALTVVLWIGAYAVIRGCLWIALALRLRTWSHRGARTPRFRPA